MFKHVYVYVQYICMHTCILIIKRSIATRHLDCFPHSTQLNFTVHLKTQGCRVVVLNAGILYGLQIMLVLHVAMQEISPRVCGDGLFVHVDYSMQNMGAAPPSPRIQ